jgi:YidC/Oxa1 family membrane protein insertase
MPTTFNLRFFLWAFLGVALLVNVEMWMHDYPPPASAATATTPATASGSAPSLDGSAPSAAAAPVANAPAAPAIATSSPPLASEPGEGIIRVRTDVLDLDIGLHGAELRRADLPAYPVKKNQAEVIRLLNRDSATSLFVLQSGLLAAGGDAAPAPTALYSAAQNQYTLQPGQDELRVPLTWTDGHGLTVTKTFVLRRGRYNIDVETGISNATAGPLSFAPYVQILRNNPPVERSYFNVDSYSFKGPEYYNGSKTDKLKLTGKNDQTLDQSAAGGWLAALQHHFVAAIVPPASAVYRYQLRTQGNQFLLSATGPTQTVAAGGSAQIADRVFVGPKIQSQLDETGPKLSLVADYGKLTMVSGPLFWLLDKVHTITGNWGVAIIFVTFLLKLVFYPLSEASGRSMAKMKALQPRIKALQETYKDEREKISRATMELYQKEKVNPLAGCLPMIIQMPVFLAFYWVLLESVEMRQAPFFGWINDLSSRDPLYILPAIMAVAMFVQYKINPQMGDPVQQKVFMIMPIAMSVMFAFFPSGLVLYWVTNTVLSIAQQWNINRRIQARPRN